MTTEDIYKELTPEQIEIVKAFGYGPRSMWGHRNTVEEAWDYVEKVAKGTESPPHVITAAAVLAHTMVVTLVKEGCLQAPKENTNA